MPAAPARRKSMAERILQGHKGWCRVDFRGDASYHDDSGGGVVSPSGTVVYATDLSYTRDLNIPMLDSYYTPLKDDDGGESVKSRIRMGFGTYLFQGSISMNVSNDLASAMLQERNFKRGSVFDIYAFDGRERIAIRNCVWSSLSISASGRELVTSSVSFISNNGYRNDVQTSVVDAGSENFVSASGLMVPYWQTGVKDALSFSLEFSRQAQPVYLNNTLFVPSYLKAGLIDVSLRVEYMDFGGHSVGDSAYYAGDGKAVVKIGSKKVTLNQNQMKTMEWGAATPSSGGRRTVVYTGIGDSSTDSLFAIS